MLFQRKTLSLDRFVLAFIYFLADAIEALINIDVELNRGLYIGNILLFAPRLYLLLVDSNIQIAFVANHDHLRVWRFRFSDVVPPGSQIPERLCFREVKDEHYSIATFKISCHYRSVFLLSCRVPKVEFNVLFIYFYFLNFKINGCDIGLLFSEKLTLKIAPKDGRLSNA